MKKGFGILFLIFTMGAFAEPVVVGSKAFTEGYILGELVAQSIEAQARQPVSRRFGLGNTGITLEALRKAEIDLYVEYTGTIAQALLHDPSLRDLSGIKERLAREGLILSAPLGFSNSYALAVTERFAHVHNLARVSDLKKLRQPPRVAFSHEFVGRPDGSAGLQRAYGLNLDRERRSMEHSLAYEAIAQGKADLIDVYTTDARIRALNLVVLEDDQKFFPEYQAVVLARADFVERSPAAWQAVGALAGSIDEQKMRELNAAVEIDKRDIGAVIADHLNQPRDDVGQAGRLQKVWVRTKEHVLLVGTTVLLAIFSGVPLGVITFRRQRIGQALLLTASLVQTIPSLALLCLLIPIFGIGLKPALVALYMYSLLPILLNTFVGLKSIDPQLLETARALGLSRRRTLCLIQLPLASRSILAGIKTSTVIGIGTATLAALIGAGGYGALIVSGLAINDTEMILLGAIPAAVMALLTHFAFGLIEDFVVPAGLNS